MEEGISIIVCCFNSSSRLQPTLEHIVSQKNTDTLKWEVIVVDNASSDNTSDKARELWDTFAGTKPDFKIVFESQPGLSTARDTGIQHAKFKFVLFCDDDNWLQENYLCNALSIISTSHNMGVLGGIGQPIFEDKEPPYFWKNQYQCLAVGSQWHKQGDITDENGVLYGAGMILNKESYHKLKNNFKFNFQVSDRIGNSLMSSGDHELCLALKRIGYRILYSESLRFGHYIPKRRTAIAYYKKLFLSFGMSEAILRVYSINKYNINSIKNDYRYISLKCCKNITKAWLKMLFNGYYLTSDKYYYIGNIYDLYKNIGVLKTTVKIKNSYKEKFQQEQLFRF